MYCSTTKKTELKKPKKIFAEGLAWPSAKGFFAEGLASGPRQRASLPRASPWALGKDDLLKKNFGRKSGSKKKSLPRAWSRALGQDFFKNYFCRKTGFTEKKTFAEGLTGGPRQSLTGMAIVTQRAKFAEGIPRQRFDLPWACLCRGPFFAEGSCGWPSTKIVFVECPRFGPRQSTRFQ